MASVSRQLVRCPGRRSAASILSALSRVGVRVRGLCHARHARCEERRPMMKKSLFACLVLASFASVTLLDAGTADACGGCFVQATERTVVTDHRMALSISTKQTVLWDQIRYSGDPAEFAWVLPVRAGAKIEESNEAFFTALDASTQPVVYAPATYGGAYGCGVTGCGSETASAFAADGPGAGQVQILSQSVVGPYETVTLRATDPSALRKWLKSHAFDIPDAIGPTIDAYVAESFDFIALRLRPDCGERSMQPVRIVTQGADPTLPLRMVAAGIGARVGLTLYVISEGRWQPQNFPSAEVDGKEILWDRTQNKSTYEPLVEELMAASNGRTWVTEYANKPQLFTAYDPRYAVGRSPAYVSTGSGSGATPGLADAYFSQCRYSSGYGSGSATTAPSAAPFTPCRNGSDAGVATNDAAAGDASDAGSDAATGDAGEVDASTEDAGDTDAGVADDAGDGDAGVADDAGGELADTGAAGASTPVTPPAPSPCAYLDDLDVAMRGLHPQDVWVTRLRASLPANALAAGDLRLEAATGQVPVNNVHYATGYTDEQSAGAGQRGACVSAPKQRSAFGSWALAAVSAIAAVALLRRRTRR
jgi:hypothetical protein